MFFFIPVTPGLAKFSTYFVGVICLMFLWGMGEYLVYNGGGWGIAMVVAGLIWAFVALARGRKKRWGILLSIVGLVVAFVQVGEAEKSEQRRKHASEAIGAISGRNPNLAPYFDGSGVFQVSAAPEELWKAIKATPKPDGAGSGWV